MLIRDDEQKIRSFVHAAGPFVAPVYHTGVLMQSVFNRIVPIFASDDAVVVETGKGNSDDRCRGAHSRLPVARWRVAYRHDPAQCGRGAWRADRFSRWQA